MHTVEELMTTHVRSVTVNDVIGPVRDLMMDAHVHAVPVLDGTGALVGIVTSSDLIEEWAPQMGVLSVMTTDVVTISAHAGITDAARAMVDRGVHHLVVVQRDEVAGILSSFDVLRYLTWRAEQTNPPTSITPSVPASGLHAAAGDVIVVRPRQLGGRERRATVVASHGEDGTAPFTVRWSDDLHDQPRLTLFFPSSDAFVEHRATHDQEVVR